MNSIRYLFLPIIALIAPLLLVATQPDLGTSILIAAGGIIVAWLAGVRIKFFVYSSIVFLSLLPVAISFLKPYQKSRILTFLNPERDPLGAGYQIIQSKIAIGSGGLFGKGFLNGSQSYLDYLPEKHTDFIFTLFSEEFGFFGSLSILLLYALIISRIVKIGTLTRSTFRQIILLQFCNSIFYLCSGKYDDGAWSSTYCRFTFTNNVIWWFLNDGNYVWLRYSYVMQNP